MILMAAGAVEAEPFQATTQVVALNGCVTQAIVRVPAGRKLLIKFATLSGFGTGISNIVEATAGLETKAGGRQILHHLTDNVSPTQALNVYIYASAGTDVNAVSCAGINRTIVNYTISGDLLP